MTRIMGYNELKCQQLNNANDDFSTRIEMYEELLEGLKHDFNEMEQQNENLRLTLRSLMEKNKNDIA